MHILHKKQQLRSSPALTESIFTYLSASPGLVGMVEQNRSKVLECWDFGMQLK